MSIKEETTEKNKEKDTSPILNVLRTEWNFLGDRKKIFTLQSLFFIIANSISLLTPLIIGLIFNSIQKSSPLDLNLPRLILMFFLLLAVSLAFWLFHGIGRIFEQMTGFYVHRNYTNSKLKKTLELPVKWHKDNHTGDTIDKINRGRESLNRFSSQFTNSLIQGIITIFGSFLVLLFFDIKIAIFSLVFAFTILFIITRVDKMLSKKYKELNKYSNILSASVFDYLSNIITVITLRLKKTVSKEVDNRLVASKQLYKKTAIINECKWAFVSISLSLMTVLALSYKAYTDYTTNGVILIGTLYILYGYLGKIGQVFYQFAWMYGDTVIADARIQGAYSIDEAYDNISERMKGKLSDNWKKIELKNINFSYEDDKKPNLTNVNFSFKKGQKIALVGESGSGKSTLLSLIRGLYIPPIGDVYVNGEKLKNGFDKLKKFVTLIPQDPEIFNNTLEYNVAMDLPHKKEELDKVAKMAQFKQVVDKLEKKWKTNVLEKGVSLSGGEKQRLALARGLLAAKNSDIVLLDEPTSSVDSLNEMKIHENIFKNFKNKTIISSIHRLHLLEKFDYIYLFDNGKIIAEGNMDEIKKNDKFRYLMKKYGLKKEMK